MMSSHAWNRLSKAQRGRELKYARLNVEPPRLRPPKPPKKEILLAFFLFIAGVLFILTGFNVFWKETLFESLPFTLLGCICFIPGAYHSYIVLQVWMGNENFSYSMIPNLD